MTYQLTTNFAKNFINKLLGYNAFDEELYEIVSKVFIDREWRTIDIYNSNNRIVKSVRF